MARPLRKAPAKRAQLGKRRLTIAKNEITFCGATTMGDKRVITMARAANAAKEKAAVREGINLLATARLSRTRKTNRY